MKAFPITLALVVGTLCPAVWASQVSLENGGFEKSAKSPAGWIKAQHSGKKSYEMTIDEKKFAEGKRSFRMQRTAKQVDRCPRRVSV